VGNSMTKPKVSVVSPTYNQEKYIRETLDGFINQKTDFNFEIIVADDCSTDDTPQIIEEYAKAYPGIVKPIIRKKNIGVAANFSGALKATRGKYIALCEGDDYWTDPEKLQLQVDFLDNNSDYALCFHPVKVIFENDEQESYIYPDPKRGSEFTIERLLKTNYIQTNSVIYRRQSHVTIPEGIVPVDWYLHLYHARFGKIGFIDRTMSVYRRHASGIWWDSHSDKDKFWKKNGLAHLAMYEAVLRLFDDKQHYQTIVFEPISQAFNALVEIADKDDDVASQAIKRFPQLVQELLRLNNAALIKYDSQQKSLEKTVANLQNSVETLQQEAAIKDNHIQNLEDELAEIKNSRAWRSIQQARAVKAKLKRKK
jgi:glycosyltransferase involved in cell wall biosynthesis